MIFSEQRDQVVKAFHLARQLVVAPAKNKQNSHLKNHYADLNSVFKAISPANEKAGLLVIQENLYEPGMPRDVCLVKTTIIHVESGQWMESTSQIPLSKIDAQGFGSSSTYCKRYALVSIYCLDSEDDDGHKAVKSQASWLKDVNAATSLDTLREIYVESREKCDPAVFKVIKAEIDTRKAEIEHAQSTGFSAPVKREKKTVQQTEQQNNEQEDF